MAVYHCWFRFFDGRKVVESEEGIDAFRHGFWINHLYQYTKGSDCKYWIPTSQIITVEKFNVD